MEAPHGNQYGKKSVAKSEKGHKIRDLLWATEENRNLGENVRSLYKGNQLQHEWGKKRR